MAGSIKGITIEINGNTTGLDESLKGVNKRSKDLQNELKQVEKALKLDPSNVELVRQKQELLTQSISETSTKLDALKQAQAQVEQQFRNGDIGEEQYRAFQRELVSTEAQLRRFENQLQSVGGEQDKLSQNQRDLQTYLNATGQSVDDLSQLLGTRLTNAIKDGSASADQLELALNRIGRQAGHSGEDLEAFRQTLRTVDNGSSLDEVRQDLSEIGQEAEETKKDFSSLTDGIKTGALAASAAITGIGVGAGMAAAQFDNAIGQIQAGLGVTREEAEALEAQARDVWKAGFGESLEEVSAGLIRVKQNMREIDGSEIEGVTKNALSLAKAFESDVNEVTRAANNLMQNFGISSGEAFDLLAYGAQNGLNFSNELFDNVAEYSGLFKTLGFTAEEYFQTLEKGAQSGVYNLDYLNDVIKEFGIRIKDGSTATSDALSYLFRSDGFDTFMTNLQNGGKKTKEFMELSAEVGAENASVFLEQLGKTGKASEDAYKAIEMHMGGSGKLLAGISDGSIRGQEAMQQILVKIQEIEDPMLRAQMGVSLFGTKWEDLEETAMFSMIGINGEIENLGGNMQGIIEVQEQTFGQRWESFTRTAASSLEPIGRILLDLAETWLPKIIVVMESLAKWFTNLSPIIQILVVAFGAIVAAIGPVLVVIGSVVSAVGSLMPLFASGGAAATAFGAVIGVLTGPVGIVIAIITALIAIGVSLYKNWDVIKEKAGQLKESIATKFNELKTAAIEKITQLKTDGLAKFEELKTSVVTKVNELRTNAVAKFEELKSNVISKVTELQMNVVNRFNELKSGAIAKFEELRSGIVNKANELKTNAVAKFTELKTAITTTISSAKDAAVSTFNLLKDGIVTAATDAYTTAKSKFDALKTAITTPIESARNTVKSAVDAIKGFFSGLSLSLPEIKMPKLPNFKLDGEFSLNPPSVPKLSVSWNALGGVFNKPTIFNTANAGLQGVGEAGPEAILPLNAETLAGIGRGIAEQMGTNAMPSTIVVQSVLDGRIVAESVTPFVSNIMGSNYNSELRRGGMKL